MNLPNEEMWPTVYIDGGYAFMHVWNFDIYSHILDDWIAYNISLKQLFMVGSKINKKFNIKCGRLDCIVRKSHSYSRLSIYE